MNLAKLENGVITRYPYTRADLRADFPDTGFPRDLSQADLSDYGAVYVEPVPMPAILDTEVAEVLGGASGVDEYEPGKFRQMWTIRDKTPEELGDIIPQVVSMRQARLALLSADLLEAANSAVLALDEAAQIEWEYALEVRRDHPLIIGIGAQLDLTEEQIDDLFIQASIL